MRGRGNLKLALGKLLDEVVVRPAVERRYFQLPACTAHHDRPIAGDEASKLGRRGNSVELGDLRRVEPLLHLDELAKSLLDSAEHAALDLGESGDEEREEGGEEVMKSATSSLEI